MEQAKVDLVAKESSAASTVKIYKSLPYLLWFEALVPQTKASYVALSKKV